MKIEFRKCPYKLVLIWLSKEESEDKNILSSLQPQFKEWKANKYQPVVFASGTRSLEDSMYLLMKHNYEVLAKEEIIEN